MNKQNFNPEAAEATTKVAIDNATKVVELVLEKSTELMEKNVTAAKALVERQSAYAGQLQGVTSPDDFVKAQEKIGKTEAEALEQFSREIYQVSSETAEELAKVNTTSCDAAKGLFNDSLEQVVKSIPNGAGQPYGSLIKDALRNQIDSFNAFNSFVEKAISAQQSNFNTLAEAVNEASVANKKTAASKRK